MKLKIAILLIAISTLLSFSLFAQGREIIPLNQYKNPLNKARREVHAYNKIITYSPDSTKIEKIYTLDNKLRSSTRENYNPDLG